MVTILALIAAALYGTADFMGGAASRRAKPLAVLAITGPAGAVVMLVAAAATGTGWGGMTAASAGWAIAGGVAGSAGLLAFYAGFVAAPMSVVSPVTALVATVLPVGFAVAQGERPSLAVAAGAVICVAAVICVSMEQGETEKKTGRLRALMYAIPAGASFGLYFLFLREAGTSGVIWPVTVARVTGTLVAVACCLALRVRPVGWRPDRALFGIAVASGALDAAANVAYVLATRVGLFGLAVVITSLYPGITVLLARFVFGERMRWVQRAGLILAGIGVALVTAQR
ncbi:MAG: EamA family transporter [Streptosporangiaceae bacterium]|jgi:drug/metabolite transporter (DMT)-like permease